MGQRGVAFPAAAPLAGSAPRVASLLLASLFAPACGYVGEPLPPLAKIPARVNDLAAIQRGGRIIVQFTIPRLTTEGAAIKDPVRLDLRIGTAAVPFQADDWAAHAKPVPETTASDEAAAPASATVAPGLARYEIPTAEWAGKEVALGVRVIGANGKDAGWSNWRTLRVVPPPDQPSGVTATATAAGVRLEWRASGGNFKVFRKTPGEDFSLVATVQQPQWTDPNTEFDKPYTYRVQTILKLEGSADNSVKEAESDLSTETTITPKDTFPPAMPSGLSLSPAPNSIELAWDRNSEPDLATYRVYRAIAEGPFEKLAEAGQIPSYSDRNVEHGKTYRYAITALDQSGNESARTPPVTVALP